MLLPEPMPLLLGVEEVPPAPEPVLLPAAPVLPGVVGVVGVVVEEDVPPLDAAPPVLLPAAPVLPEELEPVALGEELLLPEELGEELLPPEAPLPLVTLLSCRHFSRSVPVMPRHLLELEVLAPPEAESLLDEPELEEHVALGGDVLGDELDEELLGDEALGADDAPEELLGDEELPVALLLVSALLAPEDDDPVAELCATATPERASSAAAVAEQISFNVIELPPSH